MQDNLGRAYANLSELKPGDKVEVDAGFDCLNGGSVHCVHKDTTRERPGLYIMCETLGGEPQRHYLEGQLPFDPKDGDALVGVYKVASDV